MLLASTTLWLVRSSSALVLRRRVPASAFVQNDSQPVVTHGGEVPLVRIDLIEGKSQEYRAQVGDIVYQTLVDVLSVPEHDRFHVITEHPRGGLPFDRDYFGIHRTDNCIFFQITLNSGRSVELKQNFYKALANRLSEGVKLRREDVLINLIEVPKENWSFGNGVAQYIPPSH
jgi:phenylpyruvate tautomerase PptA (4-oxalocrotonate tautomerase family)